MMAMRMMMMMCGTNIQSSDVCLVIGVCVCLWVFMGDGLLLLPVK